ncbi:MAG: DNA polymerase/3'-5' exonuclease PolX [Candidatus Micrarchaeia archaeon]
MDNKKLAEMLMELSYMSELENLPSSKFEARAYLNAEQTVSTLQVGVEEIYKKEGKEGLMKLPGIGSGIADKIIEYITTGKIKKYDVLKEKYPIDFTNLLQLEGMGPKRALLLYKNLGVRDLKSLKEAVENHKIRSLPGFGEKSEEEIANSLKTLEVSKGRLLLGEALPVAEAILSKLKQSGLAKEVYIAGSLRRMRETVGDIDILAISDKPKEMMDFFVKLDETDHVIVKGITKTTVWLKIGLSCDLRVVEQSSIGSAMQYFTGSKQHNIQVREIAIKKGYKLNEYGLFDKKDRNLAGGSEESIYEKLGMQYIQPEMREARGEIELALEHKLPELVTYTDIKGDLHTHTKETDGQNSLEEIAEKAISLGYRYLAITNHTKSLKIAHGMDDAHFVEFFDRIDKLNDKLEGKLTILKGAEIDILKDGSLDLEKSTIERMDCKIAALHSSFNMSEEEMTARAVKAIESGLVNILAHPTGRIINSRLPYMINLEKIAEAAERTGTALEINSFITRLDLGDSSILSIKNYKVDFAINTDAHATHHMEFIRYGIGTARRGWLPKGRIINTLDTEALLKRLKKS